MSSLRQTNTNTIITSLVVPLKIVIQLPWTENHNIKALARFVVVTEDNVAAVGVAMVVTVRGGIRPNLNVFKHWNPLPQGRDTVGRPYIAQQRPPEQNVESQHYIAGVWVSDGISHSPEHQDRCDGMKSNRDIKHPERHYFVPDGDVNLNEGADGYLLPGENTINSKSPSHGQEEGMDSFGLPLTTFETEGAGTLSW